MRTRYGPFRRARFMGACIGGLILALGLVSVAVAAPIPLEPLAMPGILAADVIVHNPTPIPVQGANRYLTAVEASKKFASASTVVVATGETFPDALGGAALAGAAGGPLLLTPKAAVPAEVLSEITRLGATKIYVLGSEAAVSAAAFAQLDAKIAGVPVRLGGANRYDTANLVAAETIRVLGGSYAGGAFLATGMNFPDALAAGPIAAAKGMPIILANASGGFSLPAGVMKVKVLGSSSVVPASVMTALGTKYDGRLFGANRYATAKAVADYGVSLGMVWNGVGLATGENFPDALCAGPLLGKNNTVLLLTTSAALQSDASAALGAHKMMIDTYHLFGSTSALSAAVRTQAADVLRHTHETTPPYVGSHDLPDVFCAESGCHDTDLGSIHHAVTCAPCHGMHAEYRPPIGDCVTCHGELVHEDHVAIPSVSEPPMTCTVSGCHGSDAIAIHETCSSCHDGSPLPAEATCESCHGAYHEEDPHPAVASTSPAPMTCTVSGCHSTGAVAIHAEGGCFVCHDGSLPTNPSCETCHAQLPPSHTAHPAIPSTTVEPNTCTQAACHGTDAVAIHPTCASCHNGSPLPAEATCESCHTTGFEVIHSIGVAPHRVTSVACFTSTCHGQDVTHMHAVDFRGSGETPPGCAACHAPGVTPSTDCSACHLDISLRHEADIQHAAVQSAIAENSAGCVSCHGSDLMNIQEVTGEHVGCSCHAYVEAAGATACEDCHEGAHAPHVGVHTAIEAGIAGEKSDVCVSCHGPALYEVGDINMHIADAHAGCSCHAHDLAEGATECVSCHDAEYAPHGFVDGQVHMREGWTAAGGHNTTVFDVNGGSTRFDGLEGSVVIKDSSAATITATYPLPTQNVFWAADDPDAPTGAKTGLGWDSVITCYDCHTELEDVTGPQGAALLNVGLDPAFPGEFETAALWAWVPPGADGSFVATDKVDGVAAPFAASGIVQYVPGGPETDKPSAYALRTFVTTTTAIPGPAVVENPDSVICAKCHDLHNPGTGHAAAGVAVADGDGYAHYHGHDYHDNPVENAGLYRKASDGTTYTAFAALNAGDTVVKAASAGRGASGHCRNCHVAVPHGWKRPRLLVYETDSAPYNIGPSVTYFGAEAEGRTRDGVGEGGQLKGISSTRSPEMSHEGEAGEYVNWSGADGMTCQACGHHQAVPTPGQMWE